MNKNNVRIVNPSDRAELKALIRSVGASADGAEYMLKKGRFYLLMADDLSLPALHVLKQEILSRGGEAAQHKQALIGGLENGSTLIMGTARQLSELCVKLKMQQFALPDLARQIEVVLTNAERKEFDIPYCGGSLTLGKRTEIMGILNVTPDSFSDGGSYINAETAVAHAEKMREAGALIIDVGGESTRPGFKPVSSEEELARIIPVISALAARNILVSVDTYKSSVAEKALAAGAVMLNDIGGLQRDAGMAKLAAESGAPVVVMYHPESIPSDEADIMAGMSHFFYKSMEIGMSAGMKEQQFILDPGIGFMKTQRQNLQAIRRLNELRGFGRPVLLAPSRKSFIGNILSAATDGRFEGTAAAAVLGAAGGAHIVRVHDVGQISRVLLVADAILSVGGNHE